MHRRTSVEQLPFAASINDRLVLDVLRSASGPLSAYDILNRLRPTPGDQSAALGRLSRTELRQLRKDAPRVWSCKHPICDDTLISKKA